jgi:hypothetical protein
MGREGYRQAIIQRLLPSLRAFNPALILISAGFDPALGDVGNTRNGTADRAAGMDLGSEDFEWVTSEIMKIADICCAGRVVSVLEGGYGSYSAAARAQASARLSATRSHHKRGGGAGAGAGGGEEEITGSPLDRHILARSAAAHVHRLVDAYGQSKEYPLLCNPVKQLHY